MFKDKERLPCDLCYSVIYKYMRALCNECYIRNTIRQLNCRIAELFYILPLSKPPFSSIMEHQLNTGHHINTNHFNIKGSQEYFSHQARNE